ncbi:unnamed protein product [Meloidogyne enterolobii]|uniref:Uncharacterized protein n=1 Tax=Meloidogyne enterolobii TaxID=390850 RepID=A0ACB0YH14_MELEN
MPFLVVFTISDSHHPSAFVMANKRKKATCSFFLQVNLNKFFKTLILNCFVQFFFDLKIKF